MRMIVLAPDTSSFHVSAEEFERSAHRRWSPHITFAQPEDRRVSVDLIAVVRPPDAYAFALHHFETGDMLAVEATPGQVAEASAWIAEAFPARGGGEVWLTDDRFAGHRCLRAGLSARDVFDDWVQHAKEPVVWVPAEQAVASPA